jgi:hypothetical protein
VHVSQLRHLRPCLHSREPCLQPSWAWPWLSTTTMIRLRVSPTPPLVHPTSRGPAHAVQRLHAKTHMHFAICSSDAGQQAWLACGHNKEARRSSVWPWPAHARGDGMRSKDSSERNVQAPLRVEGEGRAWRGDCRISPTAQHPVFFSGRHTHAISCQNRQRPSGVRWLGWDEMWICSVCWRCACVARCTCVKVGVIGFFSSIYDARIETPKLVV